MGRHGPGRLEGPPATWTRKPERRVKPSARTRMRPQSSLSRVRSERHQPARMTVDPSGKLELEQNYSHCRGRCAREADKIVETDRRRSEQRDDTRANVGLRFRGER